jgi:acetyl esterase/lipase
MTSKIELQTNAAIGEAGIISIRLPDGPGPHPFLLGIHGGGWQEGNRKSYDWCWARLRPLNVGLVLCTHRRASQAKFPAAYDDLVHLLRWLNEHAAKQRLDRDRCGLFGCSSGGHLVLLLGTRAMKEESGILPIRALASYAGIMDVASWHQELQNKVTPEGFIGATPDEKPESYRAASPIHHLHEGVPPVWMAHDADDEVVPVSQSKRMLAALQNAGHHPVLMETDGLGHYGMNASHPDEEKEFILEEALLAFFRSNGVAGSKA